MFVTYIRAEMDENFLLFAYVMMVCFMHH